MCETSVCMISAQTLLVNEAHSLTVNCHSVCGEFIDPPLHPEPMSLLFVFIILDRCFFTLGYISLWLYFVCMVINMHSFFLYFFVIAKWLELNAPLSKLVGLLLIVDSINVQIDLTLNNVRSVMQSLCDVWSHLCRNTDNRSLNSKPVTLRHESSHLCAPFRQHSCQNLNEYF